MSGRAKRATGLAEDAAALLTDDRLGMVNAFTSNAGLGGLGVVGDLATPLALKSAVDTIAAGDEKLESKVDDEAFEGGAMVFQGTNSAMSGLLSMGGMLASTPEVAMVLSSLAGIPAAIAGGVGLGLKGQATAEEYGHLGQNIDGSNKDWSDWAAGGGLAARDWVQEVTGSEIFGDIAGVVATAGSSVGGAVGCMLDGIGGTAIDVANWWSGEDEVPGGPQVHGPGFHLDALGMPSTAAPFTMPLDTWKGLMGGDLPFEGAQIPELFNGTEVEIAPPGTQFELPAKDWSLLFGDGFDDMGLPKN